MANAPENTTNHQPQSGADRVEHDPLDDRPAAELLPLVYEELKRLAAARLAREGRRDDLMQPTSLVHAVYLRLVQDAADQEQAWHGRSHFFAAAALAMRRILVERARRLRQAKRGGGWTRVGMEELLAQQHADQIDLIALDSALEALRSHDSVLYQVVMLRYFAGLSIDETAHMLNLSATTVKRHWGVGRLWLLERIEKGERPEENTALE